MSKRPKRNLYLLVLLVYVGVAVGATWPLAAQITTHLPGRTLDTLFHYWNGWWVRQALSNSQSPFHTAYLFHPAGASLVYNNFAWLNIVGWLLLEPIAGGFTAYNLFFLFNLASCGMAAFLLTRDLTGDGRAAFLAGLIYQCWPFRLGQLDHPNLISTQWIPIFLLFLIRTLSPYKEKPATDSMRRGRRRDGVLTGLFLALTGYTRWQLLIPTAIVGGIYLICAAPSQWASRQRWIPALLLAGCVAALTLAPPILLLVNQQRAAPSNLLVEGEEATMQTDLLSYVTPSGSHPVWGTFTQPAYDRYYADRSGGRRFPAYVGVTALALALLGIWRIRQTGLPWAAMAFVLISLALGAILRVGGQLYPAVPMPYRLAEKLFIVRLLRFPDRFNMFLALPTTVLAAYGIADILARIRRHSRRAVLVTSCLLGAAILFEYLTVPTSLQHPQASPFYDQLAAESGDFAVLNLPINPQKSKLYMFAQVAHHHPILQGHTSRLPQGAHAYIDNHPLLHSLRQSGEMDPELVDVSRQLASLAEDDVRYVILHKTQVDADRLARWQRYLLSVPRFEDEQIAVYSTTPLAGRDFTLADELAPGVGPIQVITSTGCLNPGGVLEVDVGWGTTAAPGQDFHVELALVSDEGMQDFQSFPNFGSLNWAANTVAWRYYTLYTPPSLPTGIHTVTLGLMDPATGTSVGQPVSVGRVQVSQTPCTFPIPQDAVSVNAVFGNDLRLLGYRRQHDGDRLTLTLYWRSERRMEIDYKIFVHVFDPATGVPVAQDDAMPRRWAYPTTFWEPGELVEDVIPISLQKAPAGVYGVAVGVYDPATTERLPVVDETGQLQPDGRLVLPEEMIKVEGQGS